MADQILKFTICTRPDGTLDHYEFSFHIDPAPFPCGFSVKPSEMTDPTNHNEAKSIAITKAIAQKIQEVLVRTDDDSFNGPVDLSF
jgi:hypothetical protein